jgi:hypothetical protein
MNASHFSTHKFLINASAVNIGELQEKKKTRKKIHQQQFLLKQPQTASVYNKKHLDFIICYT